MKNKNFYLLLLGCLVFLIGAMFFFCTKLVAEEAAITIDNLINQLGNNYTLKERKVASDKLYEIGNEAIPALIDNLNSDDWIKQCCIIKLLYDFKSVDAVPILITLLNDENKIVQITTAYALGQIQDIRGIDPLIEILETTEDHNYKMAAIIALGLMKDKTVIPKLKGLLSDKNEQIRIVTAGALGCLGDIEGFEIALQGTYSDDINIQKDAIQSLGFIGDKTADQRLKNLISDPKVKWKNYIEVALKHIEINSLPQDQKILTLNNHLYHKNKKIIRWAINTLVDIGTPEAISLLKERSLYDNSKESHMALNKLKKFNK